MCLRVPVSEGISSAIWVCLQECLCIYASEISLNYMCVPEYVYNKGRLEKLLLGAAILLPLPVMISNSCLREQIAQDSAARQSHGCF